jgi:acyl-CoA dehydrogenase
MITKLRELTTMHTTVPVPFSEPPYLMGLPSAYYKETHFKWQKTCRAFAEETMMPYAAEWERNGDVPGRA